jgi:hypothetical protein
MTRWLAGVITAVPIAVVVTMTAVPGGTATAAGQPSKDASAVQASLVRLAQPRVATRSLPSGTRGLSYLAVVKAKGGSPPYTWSATGLPTGLKLAADGVLSGTPLASGAWTVALRVRDSRGATSHARLRLAVPASPPHVCAGH